MFRIANIFLRLAGRQLPIFGLLIPWCYFNASLLEERPSPSPRPALHGKFSVRRDECVTVVTCTAPVFRRVVILEFASLWGVSSFEDALASKIDD